jgi:hypothetical protein
VVRGGHEGVERWGGWVHWKGRTCGGDDGENGMSGGWTIRKLKEFDGDERQVNGVWLLERVGWSRGVDKWRALVYCRWARFVDL